MKKIKLDDGLDHTKRIWEFPQAIWNLINEYRRNLMELEMNRTLYIVSWGKFYRGPCTAIFLKEKYAVKKARQLLETRLKLKENKDLEEDEVIQWDNEYIGGLNYVLVYKSRVLDKQLL